ncbi:6-phosphogluconolactonase [Sphingomonas sp. SUN039]|uniref:6-phosphogluconolactonase n=1 Tax=Sphingomonas sp. SUN039 TaxID=2937787 RepID=UPI0021646E9C|nr:6-phosphogluconolactonase [Sphingomonas sp. SUN039]UVO55038.1 6-phosphogluconolactonase [Sphingomonas sp. SUN039]
MTIEAEWWDYDDTDELAEAIAGDIGFIIDSALDARGSALIALPGGKTPIAALDLLAAQKRKWKDVTIIPTDDRLVEVTSPLSNVAMLAKKFLPLGARVVPLTSEKASDYRAAGRAADARLADLPFPLDLVWLGMGADGHTASIFAGPDLDEALNGPKERRALGVMPDPMPQEAPVARVTLSKAAILSARSLTMAITGADKRAVLERAIAEGPGSSVPIGRVLGDSDLAVDIHWSA